MRRQLIALGLAVGLLLAGGQPVSAQILDRQSVSAASAGGDCTTTANSCGSFQPGSSTSLTLQVSGTFIGTLTFESTSDGVTWNTTTVTKLADGASATTTTTTGQFSLPNAGVLGLRARATAWTSGTANITATRGFAIARVFAPTFTTVTATTSMTTGTVLFAALPASADGTWVYCSDCTVATAPCTGAGTGAVAFRVAGTWRCP